MKPEFDFYTTSLDPFAAEKEIHAEQIRRLNAEIIRLRLKCGEGFTSDELMSGFTGMRSIKIGPPRALKSRSLPDTEKE